MLGLESIFKPLPLAVHCVNFETQLASIRFCMHTSIYMIVLLGILYSIFVVNKHIWKQKYKWKHNKNVIISNCKTPTQEWCLFKLRTGNCYRLQAKKKSSVVVKNISDEK